MRLVGAPRITERTVTSIRAARAFDGNQILGDTLVVIEGQKLAYIGPFSRRLVPSNTELMDLGEAFLMPGLIDAHVHISGNRGYGIADSLITRHDLRVVYAAQDCASLLWSGYTSVRDVGSAIALALRDAVEAQCLDGPRILAAGPIISQTGGHADHQFLPLEDARQWPGCLIADGVDACRHAVRQVAREGADLVKFCTTGGIGSARDKPSDSHFTLAEAEAIVDEAHRLGRRVAAHAQGTAGILTALRAGVDTVEHATYLTDECVVLARQSGAIIVPTVALREAFLASLNDDSYEMPAWRKQKQSDAIGAIESGFRLAYQAGLPIAAGSDFMGVPLREHGRNAREPISMVSLGMTHVDALRAATSTAAMALGLGDTIGRLQAGYDADVIALADDPSVDITALERVIVVIRQGLLKRWDRQELPAGAATIAPI